MFQKCPDFAILDECTDAVSLDVERKLYDSAVEKGINIFTISKRLTLEEHHEIELRLGENSLSGFEIFDIAKSCRKKRG